MSQINFSHKDRSQTNTAAFEILPFLFNSVKPTSVLDVGCGNGSWLETAKLLGVSDILGVDGVDFEQTSLKISKDNFRQHDFRHPLDLKKKFDFIISLEVAEHLPEASADNFIEIITNHGDLVMFSAAIPGQGGQNHINEQWPSYWADKFKKHGYLAYDIIRPEFWNNEKLYSWYKQNIIIYAKEGVLSSDLFKASDSVLSLVHPDIYRKKIYRAKFLKDNSDVFKLLKEVTKVYIKRLIGR
ncbi:class I SAM-dependent methyltransferase [Bizionia sp.]|uniref:class I SAM-dependent methyltransferase n=1 Tax=Bizionia sp. TaxID=1954480 RepID=UPI003A95DE08